MSISSVHVNIEDIVHAYATRSPNVLKPHAWIFIRFTGQVVYLYFPSVDAMRSFAQGILAKIDEIPEDGSVDLDLEVTP